MIDNILNKLEKSKFRSSFKLGKKYKTYVLDKGYDTIRRHAEDFIATRLAPANIPNDGHQTPMKNHPVFIAQHATATCCRSCLFKWHHIPKNKALSSEEQEYIVKIILKWINKEINNFF